MRELAAVDLEMMNAHYTYIIGAATTCAALMIWWPQRQAIMRGRSTARTRPSYVTQARPPRQSLKAGILLHTLCLHSSIEASLTDLGDAAHPNSTIPCHWVKLSRATVFCRSYVYFTFSRIEP
jgi:hypothetical protein